MVMQEAVIRRRFQRLGTDTGAEVLAVVHKNFWFFRLPQAWPYFGISRDDS